LQLEGFGRFAHVYKLFVRFGLERVMMCCVALSVLGNFAPKSKDDAFSKGFLGEFARKQRLPISLRTPF